MEKYYQFILNNINKSNKLKKIILFICKYFPYITFCLYPCVLIYLWFTKNDLLMITIIKPLSAFLIVTIFRKIINRPRPYEIMNINSLVKHKKGESFPSRHTISAFSIALACLNVNLYLGIFTIVIACFISFSRILAGVHYISDVVTSILLSIIIYCI